MTIKVLLLMLVNGDEILVRFSALVNSAWNIFRDQQKVGKLLHSGDDNFPFYKFEITWITLSETPLELHRLQRLTWLAERTKERTREQCS